MTNELIDRLNKAPHDIREHRLKVQDLRIKVFGLESGMKRRLADIKDQIRKAVDPVTQKPAYKNEEERDRAVVRQADADDGIVALQVAIDEAKDKFYRAEIDLEYEENVFKALRAMSLVIGQDVRT